jgi:hypothetical protein
MTIKDKRMFDRGDGRRLTTKFLLSGTMAVFHLAGSTLCVLIDLQIQTAFSINRTTLHNSSTKNS